MDRGRARSAAVSESYRVATVSAVTMKQNQNQRAGEMKAPTNVLINRPAERAILGLILCDGHKWQDTQGLVKPEDFGAAKHDLIFQAMVDLSHAARPISQATVMSRMGETQEVDKVALGAYLDGLAHEARAPDIKRVSITEYIDIVVHRSACRKLVAAAERIKSEAERSTVAISIASLQETATALIEGAETAEVDEEFSVGELSARVFDDAKTAKETGVLPGIVTGFAPFDNLVGTLRPGNLIVIAGETGSGKTALATQLGVCMAEQKIAVRMTSLEMEGAEIATRILSSRAGVDSEAMLNGRISDRELDDMYQATEGVMSLPFWIDAHPRQSVATIQARLERAKKKRGVKVGIIDHLQYVRPDSGRGEMHEKVAQAVDDLKAMAKRLKMVIFLLSHVNRGVDLSMINTASDVKRPTLSQLFGSSAIEKAADAVVFVHRPIWFLDRATPQKKFQNECDLDKVRWSGKAELVMPKRRSGAGFGTCKVWFDDDKTWFREIGSEFE